jgi:hypothetical protein
VTTPLKAPAAVPMMNSTPTTMAVFRFVPWGLPLVVFNACPLFLNASDPCHGLMSGPSVSSDDREQWQADITHFSEQAKQRGLVNDGAGQKRLAVLFQRDAQAAKPVCPVRTQMALDPDLIDHGLIWISSLAVLVWHGALGLWRPVETFCAAFSSSIREGED